MHVSCEGLGYGCAIGKFFVYSYNLVVKMRLTQFENIKVAITITFHIGDMIDSLRKTKLRSIH